MKKLNYSIKIVDNFLNKDDFNYLCSLHQGSDFQDEFKVYHNEINDDKIINSSIDQSFLKKIHKNYFSKAMDILRELCPEKTGLYDYSDFTIIKTKKNSKFPIHDDTPINYYLVLPYILKIPWHNFYSDKKGSNKTTIDWRPNRAVFFSRKEKETWHSYEGDGNNDRIALVYNLMTNKLKEVYKIENKNYFLGKLRFKINPYLFKYFKKNI